MLAAKTRLSESS